MIDHRFQDSALQDQLLDCNSQLYRNGIVALTDCVASSSLRGVSSVDVCTRVFLPKSALRQHRSHICEPGRRFKKVNA
jgi:hypothetical protein